MVQKAFVWATFPLAIALLFGIVWAVGSYVPDACTAWFDGPGGAPRRLSQIWCWPITIISGILLCVGGMVLGGILYVLFRLILKPLGLWDDSWTGSSGD